MLQSVGTLTLKDILRIKDRGNITNPHLPVMKGIHNTKCASLCLPFLIGGHCDSTEPCGYHLQFNDPYRLPGASNAYYAPFHEWMASSNITSVLARQPLRTPRWLLSHHPNHRHILLEIWNPFHLKPWILTHRELRILSTSHIGAFT